MAKEIINPPGLARPRGFSHGIVTTGGRQLFLAGQDASDADGRIVGAGDLVAQMERALANLRTVVEAAGGRMTDIVKLNIFVRDRDDYVAHHKPLGEVWRRFFGDYYPALALFQVVAFFQPAALVELEGMAVIGADGEEA